MALRKWFSGRSGFAFWRILVDFSCGDCDFACFVIVFLGVYWDFYCDYADLSGFCIAIMENIHNYY